MNYSTWHTNMLARQELLVLVSQNSSLTFFLFSLYCIIESPPASCPWDCFHSVKGFIEEEKCCSGRLFKRHICPINSCLIAICKAFCFISSNFWQESSKCLFPRTITFNIKFASDCGCSADKFTQTQTHTYPHRRMRQIHS